tara:strand:- start:1534 stop:2487 length:954 start_codon:yes stop_codon:yes gene_type:complete
MAVFTKISKNQIKDFLNFYDIGQLEDYNEILEGIENTNYKIICNKIPYILTIFEKRVKEDDIPFFMDLKLYLNNNNFYCPKPIKNKNGIIINNIKNKKAVIISFIQGEKIEAPNVNECKELGKIIGKLHNLTARFDKKRENNLDIKEWKSLLQKCEHKNVKKFSLICTKVKDEISFIENSWPKNLPSGIIHADLFKDNVFFMKERITGVIDFYFSCYHFYLYDIAIIVNDWCFNNNGKVFNTDLFKSILEGYSLQRKLEDSEFQFFNVILRAAAVRILVTRLHDYIFHPNDAIVVKKDPLQYFEILKWHQNNRIPNS